MPYFRAPQAYGRERLCHFDGCVIGSWQTENKMAADRHKDSGYLNNEKDLEEGEIDDLEEGEIDEEFEGTSEYRFSPREEKLGGEIDHQTERNNSYPKTQTFNHKQRNSNRNAKYTRDKDEKRADTHSTWNYEKVGRNRAVPKQNFAGKRSHENVSRADRYGLRGEAGSWDNRGCILYTAHSSKINL